MAAFQADLREATAYYMDHTREAREAIVKAKLVDIDPQAYLVDVLTKIANGHLNSRIDDPLPWAYRPGIDASDVV